jgi:hypothetical protein
VAGVVPLGLRTPLNPNEGRQLRFFFFFLKKKDLIVFYVIFFIYLREKLLEILNIKF